MTVTVDGIQISLDRGKVAAVLTGDGGSERTDTEPILLSIEAKLKLPVDLGGSSFLILAVFL